MAATFTQAIVQLLVCYHNGNNRNASHNIWYSDWLRNRLRYAISLTIGEKIWINRKYSRSIIGFQTQFGAESFRGCIPLFYTGKKFVESVPLVHGQHAERTKQQCNSLSSPVFACSQHPPESFITASVASVKMRTRGGSSDHMPIIVQSCKTYASRPRFQ